MQPVLANFGNRSGSTVKTTFDQYPIYEVAQHQQQNKFVLRLNSMEKTPSPQRLFFSQQNGHGKGGAAIRVEKQGSSSQSQSQSNSSCSGGGRASLGKKEERQYQDNFKSAPSAFVAAEIKVRKSQQIQMFDSVSNEESSLSETMKPNQSRLKAVYTQTKQMKDLVSEIMLTPVLHDSSLNKKGVTSNFMTEEIGTGQITFL